MKQIEKLSGKNKGYKAEITVVTYDRDRKDNDDKAKLRILLVSILPFISIVFIPNVFLFFIYFGSVEQEEGSKPCQVMMYFDILAIWIECQSSQVCYCCCFDR